MVKVLRRSQYNMVITFTLHLLRIVDKFDWLYSLVWEKICLSYITLSGMDL